MKVSLPNNWIPRDYQTRAWGALEAGKKRIVSVWHRRAGKDLYAINWAACSAMERPGLYWHLFPTYSQGRKVVWEGMDRGGRPFLDAFPRELYYRKRDDDMTMWLHGGSVFQVVGSDHIDRLMGANPVGIILSEYALQDPAAWELLSPILMENGGWAIFPYTPRGMNHGWDLLEFARNHTDTWFSEVLTVDDTGALGKEEQKEQKELLPRELFLQEYHCSFAAALVGAYYKEQLQWMLEQEPSRITDLCTWTPDREVVTGWDLGFGDATAIWFAQVVGRELRLIDYLESSGQPIDWYVKQLREKPYVYGDAYLPHDAAAKSLQTGRTTLDQIQNLGVRAILNQKIGLSDQHDTVRLMLRMSWLNPTTCKRGLQALKEYTKKPVQGQRGPGGETLYHDQPLHNWASHGASALATLMAGFRPERVGEFRQPDASYVV